MTAILQVREVVRAFGGLRAVDDASFDVEAGSITALIGPNGAGKSTLFNVISGFLSAERGRVQFEGRRIDRAQPHRIARRGLVRTFQVPRTLTRMSVLDNILVAATRHPGERLIGLALRPGGARMEREVPDGSHYCINMLVCAGPAFPRTIPGGSP